MKIFLLDANNCFLDELETCLKTCHSEMVVIKATCEEEFLMDNALEKYALFVLNLKHPEYPYWINHVRKNGSKAPILLMLDPNTPKQNYTIFYYLGYDQIITKPFMPEEVLFHICKLCKI